MTISANGVECGAWPLRMTNHSNYGVNMNERILIIGAGAVGSYVGGYFARAGLEVILADPWPAHVEHVQAHGLRLEGMTAEELSLIHI